MMAQTIVTLCDDCLAEGKETNAATVSVTIALAGAKAHPYEMDVCEMHAEPYRLMADHLAENARRADKGRPLPTVTRPASVAAPAKADAGKAAKGYACPVCGHVTAKQGGLRTHVATEHDGKTLAEVMGDAPLACPVPGCDRHFKNPQGRAVHLTTHHGMGKAERDAALRARE